MFFVTIRENKNFYRLNRMFARLHLEVEKNWEIKKILKLKFRKKLGSNPYWTQTYAFI